MTRLDQELVTRGLARSRTHAAKLISDGKVSAGGAVVAKASLQVDESTDLAVEAHLEDIYVSRAGHKLAGALEAFPGVEPSGKRCLDAGASTGGFTDVLLRRGASHVVAVDVGHGQLVPQLRGHPDVSVHEGLNVRYMKPEDIGGRVQLTVGDLSFISLTLVAYSLAQCTEPGGDVVLMVKPQFEVGKDRLSRTGVVSSEQERRRAVAQVARASVDAGLELMDLAMSPLPGQDGNVEYFLWMRRRMSELLPKIEERDEDVAALINKLWPNQ
ncbi:TlyA family RNA methyltransferase [Paenarthrobacter ilicis]|uniref:23S rRNA (Cytidine1920-2'-O)/16S rRNA (Cytidine1409-2'-O)-methyltransferase n=1 Tax=Paenarthrobacter ilicis TaxID=43665 RepID=A0ABX0TKY7_9MICC|nr:TlyA family RNA methyltransferase [Paenarthrobacter ilicis]MBM7792857.1 23S rRNA (cytidine1920-2'-O)/16S rRNA (cytidine1409-2'-O)-methyltransferase [Paenarthrobacter ilicis]NIJ03233.1 23S rRNA (cytidine1920-2'-O)/16S rRNA (cytidine1409-2'-O)-methyltransferase [Paenarthrobacter ilicis]